jgi:hypothetical protein
MPRDQDYFDQGWEAGWNEAWDAAWDAAWSQAWDLSWWAAQEGEGIAQMNDAINAAREKSASLSEAAWHKALGATPVAEPPADPVVQLPGGLWPRLPSDGKCECGAAAGALHHRYCDGEECPACGKQLITCEVLGCNREGL